MAYTSRKYPRVACSSVVHISNPVSEEETVLGVAEDMGRGGCRLETVNALGTGRVLLMRIGIGLPAVRVIGRVLHECASGRHTVRQGVEFLHIEPEDAALLDSYIEERLRMAP